MIDSPAKLPGAAPLAPPTEPTEPGPLRAAGTTAPGSQERGYDFLLTASYLALKSAPSYGVTK